MPPQGWILIVDDDEDIRDVIALILQTRGYRTVAACDGQDALDHLQRNGPPSLVLLDLMMPRLNGEGFAAEMRSRPETRDVPIVVLSGDTAGPKTAAAMRATGYLAKPVELATLLATIERHVRR
jgi:CheY-like chemotaxis protein